MKFRFCGDLDCPDWILAEINTLARMSSVKMKLLCQQVAKSLQGDEIDYEKVKKLTTDSKLDPSDGDACVAAVRFLLSSATRHACPEDTLSGELQQLGLPREHTTALCKVYADAHLAIRETFAKQSLRLSRLENVRWRVDHLHGSSNGNLSTCENSASGNAELQLELTVRDCVAEESKIHRVHLLPEQVLVLLQDLKRARSLMEAL